MTSDYPLPHANTPQLSIDSRRALLPTSFDEVLQLKPIADGVNAAVTRHLDGLLVAQGGNVAVQSVDLLANKGGLLVKFTGQHQSARLMMDGSGKIIPTLVDPKTGKILENARAVKGLKVMGKIANIAAIAVSVANIVSAYDQVKKLESIEKKMDFLIKARRWDQAAKLEAIYTHAREILSTPEFGHMEKRALHDLCRELHELRIAWRHELEYKLDQVKAERNGGFWSGLADLFNKNSREQKHVASVQDSIGILDAEMHLVEVSIALQTALAWAADKHEVLLTQSLPAECKSWNRIWENMTDKLTTLDKYKHAEERSAADQLSDRISGMVTRIQTHPNRLKSAFEPMDIPIEVAPARKSLRKKSSAKPIPLKAAKKSKSPQRAAKAR